MDEYFNSSNKLLQEIGNKYDEINKLIVEHTFNNKDESDYINRQLYEHYKRYCWSLKYVCECGRVIAAFRDGIHYRTNKHIKNRQNRKEMYCGGNNKLITQEKERTQERTKVFKEELMKVCWSEIKTYDDD